MAQILLPSDLSMSLYYNDHKLYYDDLDQVEIDDWISEEEKKKAIEKDSHWRIYWYPNTPVGSYSASGSTFEAVVRAVREQEGGYNTKVVEVQDETQEG